MKSRPRNAENRVAEELTLALNEILGDFVFERVPVIGRSGPDLTYPNPLNLAIDVKTRQEIPKGLFKLFPIPEIPNPNTFITDRYPPAGDTCQVACYTADYWVCKLHALPEGLLHGWWYQHSNWRSQTVWGYYEKMAKWASEHTAIPALVLHRPHIDYKNSLFITHRLYRRHLATIYREALLRATRCLPANEL